LPVRSREIHLTRYPAGPVSERHFTLAMVDVPRPQHGEVLVRNTFTSVDPALRIRMAPLAPAGYFPAFPLHQALDGIMTVGVVVDSRTARFAVGDAVWHRFGWREYAIVRADDAGLGGLGALTRLDTARAPVQAYLGPLGGMGLTAWAGLFEIAGLRDGDIVWVSAAAGAVGSLAAQFAKLRGHRVIGSAGSDTKVRYLREELRLDAAFSHRAAPIAAQLAAAAPNGIDVYFDNVGGDHLEVALGALRPGGRVALCGAISEYERPGHGAGPHNLFSAIANELTLRGFRGSSHVRLLEPMQEQVSAWLGSGALHYRESITEGLEHAPRALVAMLGGETLGKTLVRIAE
jgi:NADPH-dependent curcumin reductase CurA